MWDMTQTSVHTTSTRDLLSRTTTEAHPPTFSLKIPLLRDIRDMTISCVTWLIYRAHLLSRTTLRVHPAPPPPPVRCPSSEKRHDSFMCDMTNLSIAPSVTNRTSSSSSPPTSSRKMPQLRDIRDMTLSCVTWLIYRSHLLSRTALLVHPHPPPPPLRYPSSEI